MREQSPKQRHGCLTAFLIYAIISNALALLFYLLAKEQLKELFPNASVWLFVIMALMAAINLICIVALFRWRKWGFWGCCATTPVVFIVNLSIESGTRGIRAITGLLGLGILYIVLQTGKQNRGWPQLE